MRFAAILLLLGLGQEAKEGEIRDLINRLRSDLIEVRVEAQRKLILIGEPALPELQNLAHSPDKELSARGAAAIRAIQLLRRLTPNASRTLPGLRERLATDDEHAWTRAFLEAAEQTPTKRRYPGLGRDDLDSLAAPAVRGAKRDEILPVCQAVAAWRLRSAVPDLLARLPTNDGELMNAVLNALGGIGAREAAPHLIRWIEDSSEEASRFPYVNTLCALGAPESRATLVKILPVLQTGLRSSVLWALADLDAEEAIPVIVHLFKTHHVDSSTASQVLARLGPSQTVPGIVRLLENENKSVRAQALAALAQLTCRAAIPELAKILTHPDPNRQLRAASGLAALGRPEGLATLTQLLRNPDGKVSLQAAQTLARMGVADGLPQLVGALGHDDAEVRKNALWAMSELGSKAPVAELRKLIREGSPLRGLAAYVLGRSDSPEAQQDLPALLKDPSEEVRELATYGLAGCDTSESRRALIELLKDAAEGVRAAAVRSLVWLNARDSAASIVPLLKDSSTYVVFHAARALGNWDARNALSPLMELLDAPLTSAYAARALAVLGASESIPALQALLTSPQGTPYVRQSAARALSRLGAKDGVSLLLQSPAWGNSFLELNALRRPDVWRALEKTRLEGTLRGPVRELILDLASKLKFRLEMPPDLEEPWLHERRTVRLQGLPALEALSDVFEGGPGPILEPGVLRIVPRKEAVRFWRRWWAEGQLKSENACDRDEASRMLDLVAEADRPAAKIDEPLKDELTPSLKTIPGLLDRLAAGGDATWTEVLLETQRKDKWALYRSLRPEDLDVLAPAGLRGAVTPQEMEQVLGIIASKRLRRATPEVAKRLEDPAPSVRVGALKTLASVGAQEELPRIAAVLESAEDTVVSAALNALGRLGAREHVPKIRAYAREGSPAVRLAAASVLADWRDSEALPALAGLMKDPEYRVRRSVAFALTRFGGADVTPLMRELLKDSDENVVQLALHFLEGNGMREARADILDLLDRGRCLDTVVVSLETLGVREALPGIRKLLHHDAWHVAQRAAQVLADMGAREAIPELRKILQRGDVHSTWIAGPALVEFADKESIPQFLRLLKATNWQVRASAAEALAALGGREVLPDIREAVKQPEGHAVIPALVRLAPEEAIPFLRERRNWGDGVNGLLELRQREVRPIIERWLQDPSPQTRGLGLTSLFRLEGQGALPAVRSYLTDPEESLRETAAALLTRAGQHGGVPILIDSKKDLFLLNAVREPRLWDRISTTRLDEPFYGNSKEIMEYLAWKLGVGLEGPPSDAAQPRTWTDYHRRIGSRLKPSTVAEALEHFRWFVVLESDRLRVIAPEQAAAFWSAWWEREGGK